MTKKLLITTGLLILSIFVYYIIILFIARGDTHDLVDEVLSSDKIKLELNDLTQEQIDILLRVQDPNFYNHQGVDFNTPGTGVTTISQGLVKMYYFKNFAPGIQKVEQTLVARFAFDPLVPKDTILKLFINEVYLGEQQGKPLKGFADASEYYFKKDFKHLNPDEYLSLVSMIRAPFKFHYLNKKAKNLERVNRIKKVLSGEYIPIENSDIYYDRY